MVLQTNRCELIGQIMDSFEDFLEKKGISIPSSERQKIDDNNADGNDAILYGDDYSEIADSIEETLINWCLLESNIEIEGVLTLHVSDFREEAIGLLGMILNYEDNEIPYVFNMIYGHRKDDILEIHFKEFDATICCYIYERLLRYYDINYNHIRCDLLKDQLTESHSNYLEFIFDSKYGNCEVLSCKLTINNETVDITKDCIHTTERNYLI